MSGWASRDGNLTRIIVARCDVDLGSIKLEYRKLYGKTLNSDVTVSFSELHELIDGFHC